MNSLNSKNLESRTVQMGWWVTLSGVIGAIVNILAIWNIISPEIKMNLMSTLPLVGMVLGPLVVHFRVNQRAKL